MKFLLFFFIISNVQLSFGDGQNIISPTCSRSSCNDDSASKLQLQTRWAGYTQRIYHDLSGDRVVCVCVNSVDDGIIIILLLTSVLPRRMNIL